jgi:2'-5' RNA ligase
MSKSRVIDEVHLTLRVPTDLPDDEAEAVRDALAADEFMARLRRAMRAVIRAFPELTAVRVSINR